MSYQLTEKEISAVLKISIAKRIKYFVNRVADECYLWLKYDKEGNLFAVYDSEDNDCVPVWPAKEYGETVLKDCPNRKYLKKMEIHKFLEEYIDELQENNMYIVIFPDENFKGAMMEPKIFRDMMQEELDRME